MASEIIESKMTAGRYRLSGHHYFSNVTRKPDGWHADLRREDGTLQQFAGIWRTKRDAIDEATHLIKRHDEWTI